MADEENSVIDVATGVADVAGTVFDVFAALNSHEKCLVEVSNGSGAVLKRLSDNHSSGAFATLPENEIAAGGSDAFVSHDTGVLRGAVGEVTYEVVTEGPQAAQGKWTIRWSIPQVGDPSCSHELVGLDPAFKATSRIGGGAETEAKFELTGPGGRKPGGKTDPVLKSTVLIEVRNHTDQPLTLLDQGHDHGGFVTRPADELPAGAVDSFASFETDRAEKQGSQGFVKYAVGKTGTTWTISWHNPENADNTSDSVLDGAGADEFLGLDQIGAGEENVPAVFTLSQGGGGKPGTRNTVEVTVVNDAGEALTMLDHAAFTGEFLSEPPQQIPAGEAATFSCAETEGRETTGCQGFVRYHTADVAACLWTLLWNNPEAGENTAESTVTGAQSARFVAEGAITADKAAAAATFTLTGEPPAEPEFTPPVERDEPTLRHGDRGVDGWVEYLQTLLVEHGYGPLQVDGVFGNAVLAAVRRFQTDRRDEAGGRLMVDGVVGNQTWAVLREESPRPPSTDGREPHTYVEHGAEARFYTEDNAILYFQDDDTLMLFAVNTGDESIHPGQFEAHARITFPDGVEQHTFLVELPAGSGITPPGEVFFFQCELTQAIRRGTLAPGAYRLEAYLPDELGGDQTEEILNLL